MPKFSHPCIYQTKLKISTSFFPFHTKKGEKIIKAARTHSLANSLTDNLLTKEFNSQKRKEKKEKRKLNSCSRTFNTFQQQNQARQS